MPEYSFILKIIGAFLIAVVVSFATTPLVKRMAYKVGAIDVPKDERRMHKTPIPRLGGLAIFIAFLFSVLLFADIDRQFQGILLGLIMIVVLGVMDDILTLKALPKFLVQIAAAGVAVYHGCVIQFVSNPNVFSSNLLDRCHYKCCEFHRWFGWISSRGQRNFHSITACNCAHGSGVGNLRSSCCVIGLLSRFYSIQHEPCENIYGGYGRHFFRFYSGMLVCSGII